MHRLWYDLRTQSMFEPELREAVLEIDHTLELMIWRIVRRYADLSGGEPVFSSPTTYALFDGLFEKGLLGHLSGDPVALDDLARPVRWRWLGSSSAKMGAMHTSSPSLDSRADQFS